MTISQKDNQLSGAQNLGTLVGSVTRRGFVGRKDKIDFLKFALSQESTISLALKRSSANANVKLELRSSTGAILERSQKGGQKLETIAGTDLESGTYYIGVKRFRGDTNYTLTASAANVATPGPSPSPRPSPSPNPSPSPSPSSTRFSNLGVLSGTSSVTNSLGKTSDPSFKKYSYRFELNQISDLNVNLGGLSDSVNMTLYYDANANNQIDSNETFSSASGSGSQNATISTTFPKGTYFLDLEYTGFTNPSTTYQLNLTQTSRPGNLPSDPSSSPNSAYDLGTLSGVLPTQIDLAGRLDDRDFYKFKVDQIGDFNANISGLTKEVDITLIYDANGNGLVDASDPSTKATGYNSQNGTISLPIPKGTYFLDLDYDDFGSFNTRYELNLSHTAKPGNLPSDPSGSPNLAYDLGTISSNRTLIDLVGPFDGGDIYKFNLGAVNNLTVNLGGLTSGVDMYLYYDANGNGLLDSNEQVANRFGSGNLIISRDNPSAGKPSSTYFISLLPYLGTNTRYELTLGTA